MKAEATTPSPTFQGSSSEPPQSQQHYPHPYIHHAPAQRPSNSPMESSLRTLETWTKKAEATANNVWHNRKSILIRSSILMDLMDSNCWMLHVLWIAVRTSPSVTSAAWGKMNLAAKAMSGGGFESLYKQNFAIYPSENLRKTFACYLSTSAGAVAGTLYLSNLNLAFCSDSPVSFTSPSGQETSGYYKVNWIM